MKKEPRKETDKGAEKAVFYDDDRIKIIINKKVSAERTANDYLTEEDHKFMENEAYKFYVGIPRLHPRLKDYFDYNNLNMLDYVEEEFCFKSVFSYTVSDIVKAIGTVSKIIDAEKPYKLIVNDDISLKNRIALMTARGMGLKTEVKGSGTGKKLSNMKSAILSLGYEAYLSALKLKRRLWKSAKKGKGQILFLPYYANHADVMNPLIKLLKEKKEGFDVVCVDNIFNVTRKRLKKYSIDYEIFEHYTDKKVRSLVRMHRKGFRRKWKQLDMDLAAKKSLSYRKINLWKLLRPRLRFLFTRRFVQVSDFIETTRNLLAQKNPSIAIIANDTSTYGRVAASVAGLEDTPCLLIQHGAAADEAKYNRIFAEKMAVEGPDVKKSFVDRGLKKEKFIVTGQPRYDVLARKEDIPSREEMCRKLRIPENKKIITLATQVPECDEHVVRSVYDAVKGMDNAFLVVKLHPAERTDAMYHKVRKETGIKNVLIGKDIHLYGLLDASEMMMTVFSTTALEAMMLGKPVITINLTGKPDMMPYASSGAALGVYKAGDVKKAVSDVLNDRKMQQKLKNGREKFIYGIAYKMDGMASQRVLDLIRKLKKS